MKPLVNKTNTGVGRSTRRGSSGLDLPVALSALQNKLGARLERAGVVSHHGAEVRRGGQLRARALQRAACAAVQSMLRAGSSQAVRRQDNACNVLAIVTVYCHLSRYGFDERAGSMLAAEAE